MMAAFLVDNSHFPIEKLAKSLEVTEKLLIFAASEHQFWLSG
jgi:hypothetical protein